MRISIFARLKNLLPIVNLFLTSTLVYSQNLEDLKLSKGIEMNGSVNLSTIGYFVHGIDQRREPFNWFLTGNLNVSLFGYSAPFSFSHSNANTSYAQPFNQFAFSPSYKSVKLYLGYNSMTFSPYTLASHVFFGSGIEVSPGNWSIAAMYGRLRKPVPFNLIDSLQQSNASYERMGYGLKVGYEKEGSSLSTSFLTAQDDPRSIPFVVPGSELKPMENVAISVAGRKLFFKRFFVDAEYAVSVMNLNTLSNTNEGDSTAYKQTKNLIRGLLPENATNRYFDALNSSIGYQGNWYSIQLRYERVAPEYQTLGAYYFNNDLQNITINPTLRVLKNTLQISGNVGLQRNNLNNARASTTKRFVGAVNVNYLPNEKWNLTTNYSNFSSFTNMRPQSDPNFQNNLDTLNFYQLSETMTAGLVRMFGKKESPKNIMMSISHQTAENASGYEGGDHPSDFISTNVAYSQSIVPLNLAIAITANIYTTRAAGTNTTFYGPTASLTKSFFEKRLRGSLTSSYNKTTGNKIDTGAVLNNRINVSFAPSKNGNNSSKNNFSLGINMLRRLRGTESQPSFTEWTGNLNYTFTF